MSIKNIRLGFLGAGVMGQSIATGLIKAGAVKKDQMWLATRTEGSASRIQKETGLNVKVDYEKDLKNTDLLIVCVKPHQAQQVMEGLKKKGLAKETLVVSIMTGVSSKQLENWLSSDNPVIRAMPNTACVVGHSMTVLARGAHAGDEDIARAQTIFENVGKCVELDESLFNAVTGLSGSGPAYLYLIMEALADGGVRVGLPRAEALSIITQTILGAAHMVQQTGKHPAALRDEVTTPAGCTIGALLVMEDGKIRSVLARAVEEATRIAAQLGQKAKE